MVTFFLSAASSKSISVKDFLRHATDKIRYTIIDEADEMVSPDWVEEMRNVMGGADVNTDDDHVYMMFSATFPKEARAVAKEYMSKDHIRIRVGRAGSSHMNIVQKVSAASQALQVQAYNIGPFRR